MIVNYDNLTTMNSNNLTTASTSYIRWQRWNWILPETVNSIFILTTIWILFTLIYYGNKSKMWVTTKKKNFEKLNAGFILMTAVLCAVMALFRFISSQFVFNIGFSVAQNNQCKIVFDISVVSFCLANFAVFVYLWVRQLVFYTNCMLNTDFSKALRFFSYLSIILISLGGLGVILGNTIPTKYMSSLNGCVVIPIDSTSTTILALMSSLVFLSGQIILVGLLIYPLHKHSKQEKCLTLCGLINWASQNDDQQKAHQMTPNQSIAHCSGTNKKINMVLRRTVWYSIIIVVGTLVLYYATIYGLIETNIFIMLYDVVAFANLAFVVSSIGGWKKIVCLTLPTYLVTVNAAQQESGA